MDDDNISDLKEIQKKVNSSDVRAEILMLGEQDPNGEREVPDPYYGSGSSQFDDVLQQCKKACDAFLDKVYQ
uniref:protein-tyrosine-phosphatase n=1 Tax=Caenorhabditis japonica TaxID=281687 RepID=A0A8R1HNK8_CAEJA